MKATSGKRPSSVPSGISQRSGRNYEDRKGEKPVVFTSFGHLRTDVNP